MSKNKIRTVSTERLECTDFNHMWTAHDGGRRGYGWFRVLRCPRCKVKRHQTIARNGAIESTWYDYSEAADYLVKGGRLTVEEKNANRLQALKTLA